MKYRVTFESGDVQIVEARDDIDVFKVLEKFPLLPKGIEEIECLEGKRTISVESIEWFVGLYNRANCYAQYAELMGQYAELMGT